VSAVSKMKRKVEHLIRHALVEDRVAARLADDQVEPLEKKMVRGQVSGSEREREIHEIKGSEERR